MTLSTPQERLMGVDFSQRRYSSSPADRRTSSALSFRSSRQSLPGPSGLGFGSDRRVLSDDRPLPYIPPNGNQPRPRPLEPLLEFGWSNGDASGHQDNAGAALGSSLNPGTYIENSSSQVYPEILSFLEQDPLGQNPSFAFSSGPNRSSFYGDLIQPVDDFSTEHSAVPLSSSSLTADRGRMSLAKELGLEEESSSQRLSTNGSLSSDGPLRYLSTSRLEEIKEAARNAARAELQMAYNDKLQEIDDLRSDIRRQDAVHEQEIHEMSQFISVLQTPLQRKPHLLGYIFADTEDQAVQVDAAEFAPIPTQRTCRDMESMTDDSSNALEAPENVELQEKLQQAQLALATTREILKKYRHMNEKNTWEAEKLMEFLEEERQTLIDEINSLSHQHQDALSQLQIVGSRLRELESQVGGLPHALEAESQRQTDLIVQDLQETVAAIEQEKAELHDRIDQLKAAAEQQKIKLDQRDSRVQELKEERNQLAHCLEFEVENERVEREARIRQLKEDQLALQTELQEKQQIIDRLMEEKSVQHEQAAHQTNEQQQTMQELRAQNLNLGRLLEDAAATTDALQQQICELQSQKNSVESDRSSPSDTAQLRQELLSLQSQLASERSQNSELKSSIDLLKQEKSDLSQQWEQSRGEYEAKCQRLEDELHSVSAWKRDLEISMHGYTTKNAALIESNRRLEAEVESLTRNKSGVSGQLDAVECENSELKKQIGQLTKDVESARSASDALRLEHDRALGELNSRLHSSQTLNQEQATRIAALEENISASSIDRAQLIADTSERLHQERARLQKIEEQYNALQTQYRQQVQANEAAQSRLQASDTLVSDLQSQLAKSQAEVQKLNKEYLQLKDQGFDHRRLALAHKTLTDEQQGCRVQLSSAQEELSQLKAALHKTSIQNESLKKENEGLHKMYSNLSEEKSRYQHDSMIFKAQLDELTAEIKRIRETTASITKSNPAPSAAQLVPVTLGGAAVIESSPDAAVPTSERIAELERKLADYEKVYKENRDYMEKYREKCTEAIDGYKAKNAQLKDYVMSLKNDHQAIVECVAESLKLIHDNQVAFPQYPTLKIAYSYLLKIDKNFGAASK
ncbi:uncharacterized protein BJ171DRAFT_497983 [Polychytrium aggregatum]|uniref:uncharacterized protein n=1 Tax=Polychytrium aggregatum TaxID=110093 RepID=UPI0022FE8D6B|nr:uncharacterized protein BJ171DRAFT_497983 [Polychytrium aggregatum]KAI9206475.1 hypothetical protein BJ171DRAFT_497983 [Polychytrium aggregatum]